VNRLLRASRPETLQGMVRSLRVSVWLTLFSALLGGAACVDTSEAAATAGALYQEPAPAALAQAQYEFSGCENVDNGCPRLGTVGCALKAIRARHDACESASDCVEAPVDGDCTGWLECEPPLVNARALSTYQTEAGAEVSRYCENAVCSVAGLCAKPEGSRALACVQGRCVRAP